MGWNNGPPSWGEMERVLNGKPRRLGHAARRAARRRRGQPGLVAQARRPTSRPANSPLRSGVPYAELHAHSAYSFLDGASTPEELVEEAVRLDLRAIALTDHDGLYGVVRFAEAAKELDMRTVFGAELSLGNTARTEDPDPPGPHLLVLARGPEGYRRLSRQTGRRASGRRREGQAALRLRRADRGRRRALAHPDRLPQRSCAPGALRPAGRRPRPRRWPIWWTGSAVTGSASNSLTTAIRSTTNATPHWPRSPRRFGLAVVATTAAHFAEPGAGRLAMAMGAIRARQSLDEAAGWLAPLGGSHLRSGDEMARLFVRYPEAVTAAADLGEQCAFELALIAPQLPPFDVPDGHTEDSWLRELAMLGAAQRYGPRGSRAGGVCPDRTGTRRHRQAEVPGLLPGGARHHPVLPAQQHPVPGPGIGGQLGGLLRAGGHRRRPGRQRVCSSNGSCPRPATGRPTSTSTSNPTCARRPSSTSTNATAATTPRRSPTSSPTAGAARCATWPARWASPRASRTPGASRSAAGTALADSPDIEDIPEPVVDLAMQIRNLPRHMGIHSGGMVICDRPIADVCPVEWARMENRSVLQWDKDDCAAIGLVKFDLLGLGMLSALHYCIDLVAEHKGIDVDLAQSRPLRAGGLRDAAEGRLGRGVPGGVARADGHPAAPETAGVLRPGGGGGADPARAHPGRLGAPVHQAAQRARTGGLRPSVDGAGAAKDVGGAAVPGTADAAGGGLRGLLGRRGRPVAPGHGVQALHREDASGCADGSTPGWRSATASPARWPTGSTTSWRRSPISASRRAIR